MSVRKPKKPSSDKSAPIQKPIHTRYDQFGGHGGPSQTQPLRPAYKAPFFSRLAAQSEKDRPVRESVLSEVEQLRDNQQIEKHWRKRVKTGLQAIAAYEAKKAKDQKIKSEDDPFPSEIALYDPVKHLPAFYIILAVFRDRMRHGFNRIISKDQLAICPKITQHAYPAWFLKECLKYVTRDLRKNRSLKTVVPPKKRKAKVKRHSFSQQLPYVEISLIQRSLNIGEKKIDISGDKAWDFLKELCDSRRLDMPDPTANQWKNQNDQLRRTLQKEVPDYYEKLWPKFISKNRGRYKLGEFVTIIGGTQIGTKRR